jgi:hypothetical protein
MTNSRIRAEDLISEWSPRYSLRLSMHRTGDTTAVVRRHRVSRHYGPDTVAGVQWGGGVQIEWDDYHAGARSGSAFAWMADADPWCRGRPGRAVSYLIDDRPRPWDRPAPPSHPRRTLGWYRARALARLLPRRRPLR